MEYMIEKRHSFIYQKERVSKNIKKLPEYGSLWRIVNTPILMHLTENDLTDKLLKNEILIINENSEVYDFFHKNLTQKMKENPEHSITYNMDTGSMELYHNKWANTFNNKACNSLFIKNTKELYKLTNIKGNEAKIYDYKTGESLTEDITKFLSNEDYVIRENTPVYKYILQQMIGLTDTSQSKTLFSILMNYHDWAKVYKVGTIPKKEKTIVNIKKDNKIEITTQKGNSKKTETIDIDKIEKKIQKDVKDNIKKDIPKEKKANSFSKIPQDVKNKFVIVESSKCHSLEDVILPDNTRNRLDSVIQKLEMEALGIKNVWKKETVKTASDAIILALYGYSGTGKTSCVKGIAKKLDKNILQADFASMGSKYIGENEKNLKEYFDIAKKYDLILFFDEADTLLRKRGGGEDAGSKSDDKINNVFMQELDRFDGIVVLATNIIQNLDGALKSRIGGKSIFFDLPDKKSRKAIFELNLTENIVMEDGLTEWIADETETFSGRDITKMLDSVFELVQYKIFKNNTIKSPKELEKKMKEHKFTKIDFKQTIEDIKFNKNMDNKKVEF